jgi:hypothetical protein
VVRHWIRRPGNPGAIQTVREDTMRSTITAFALIGGLVASEASHAQGTPSPSIAPKQPAAPVGHRQPRQSDLPPPTRPSAEPVAPATTTNPEADDPDARLNRVLNGICRGC